MSQEAMVWGRPYRGSGAAPIPSRSPNKASPPRKQSLSVVHVLKVVAAVEATHGFK